MEKKDKFNLAEVLGVEEDERWTYPTVFGLFRVHNGVREHYTDDNKWIPSDDEVGLVKMLNHPESIIHCSPLTEEERERCRVCGAKWIAKDKDSAWVSLYSKKPTAVDTGYYIGYYDGMKYIGTLHESLFPSVHNGDCICVEEASGDA